jgi:hypothetical protein
MAAEEDCWDAFGSDDEDEEDERVVEREDASAIALHLSQFFLKTNAQVKLSDRVVGLIDTSHDTRNPLEQRGMMLLEEFSSQSVSLDALVVLEPSTEMLLLGLERLLPGGILVSHKTLSVAEKDFLRPTEIYDSKDTHVVARVKRAVHVHSSTCPWLPSSHSVEAEQERLQEATITASSFEVSKQQLTESSIQRAVNCMNQCGYCVVRNILDSNECLTWGKTVLDTVHDAAKILLERDQVDILNPHNSISEPQSYRELSMREDLRLDLRHGPKLSKLRSSGEKGNEPLVVSASTREFNGFLRGHASLLEIVRRTMNPKLGDLYKGNLGRYNFEGSGADGSFQDLRVSPVGGIVSFPGAADQAIHADTPHLFENLPDLPAHYINIFAPAVPFDERVGGTAFFHGSHNLAFTAKYCGSDDDYVKAYPFLVRPCLTVGDVVLFDCRMIHFGLHNTSESIERALLYTNTTHAWFHDPKNWDNQRPIFEKDE